MFSLLFKKSYWRQLSLRSTWFEAWLSLRRAHKDPRARAYLRRLAVLLLIPVLSTVYFVWLFRTGALLVVLCALPLVWWLGWRRRKQDEPIHIAPQPEPPRPKLSAEQDTDVAAQAIQMTQDTTQLDAAMAAAAKQPTTSLFNYFPTTAG